MAGLRSGLSVYCMVAPSTTFYSLSFIEVSRLITELSFASAAPGGFTTLSMTLSLRDARIPRPEFALFSLVAVMSGPTAVWLGEITDPEIGMDATLGEYVKISALGLGNVLRDDPIPITYTAQTARAILRDQLARRTNNSPYLQFTTISTDNALIFPDNPATTYSPVYDNRTFEEVVADVATLQGDYQWGVWAHGTQKNDYGFPVGQLSVQLRDTATTHYMASIAEGDVIAYTVTPSAERAYNVIRVDYSTTTGGVGVGVFNDSRLNATSYAQNAAPFRARKLVRDYSGTSTIGASEAGVLASTYGNEYKNVSNKVSLTLQRIKDSTGNVMPLWEVLADHNVFIRDFAVRGNAPLPASPTAGVNQFYIVNAEYREDSSGAQQLTLQGDNFVDHAATQIARLTLAADVRSRTNKTAGATVQAQGAGVSGYAVIEQSNATSGQACGAGVQFVVQLYQPPTSLGFTQLTSTNLGSPSASNFSTLGARVQATASASAAVAGAWTYLTSGNCLRRIGRTRFDWHCDGCGREFFGLSLAREVRVVPHPTAGVAAGHVALAIDCPECGAGVGGHKPYTESFNTALTALDEAPHHYAHRREQAHLIRALMAHSAVGLEPLP